MEYKMIVLDLDGTLTNRDKIITPRTKQALMEAQKRERSWFWLPGGPQQGSSRWQRSLSLQRTEAIFYPITAV